MELSGQLKSGSGQLTGLAERPTGFISDKLQL
jgi:hypothetical protein